MQSAYEISVFSVNNSTAVWQSGIVSSSATQQVVYGGAALVSDAVYTWQVRYWDLDGTISPWSQNFTFSTGLLSAADWPSSVKVCVHLIFD